MEKIWLKSYPSGLPEEIDADRFSSVAEIWRDACSRYADRPAYSNMGAMLSYRDMEAMTASVAGYLRDELKLEKGDRVAIMMPNLLQYPIALFGVLRAGLAVVNVNPLYTARELQHQLSDSGAKAIFILANFADTLEQVIDKTSVEHVVLTEIGDCLPAPKRWLVNFVVRYVKKMVPAHRVAGVPMRRVVQAARIRIEPDIGPQDVAFLQYTGGTTGVAKGAVLTHRNIVANVQQTVACLEQTSSMDGSIIVTPLPLYHVLALTANCLAFVQVGALNVLITNPRDIPAFVKELSKWKFSVLTGVNTLFNALLNDPAFHTLDFSALRIVVGGGMAVQSSVAQKWKEVTGTVLIEGYGLTETSPVVCVNPVDLGAYNGSIGLPVPSTEVSFRDTDGNEVPLGEPGELWVRGPQVMQGYWQRSDATAEVLTDDGWLKTGDVAAIDEQGYVRIVDRKKDMIVVSGFNVYPNEVEDAIAAHDEIMEVGCIGVPDEKTGEAVKIFVVLKAGSTLTAEAIKAHAREQLTAYKVPRQIEFRDELPKSNVGKILRRELRDT
ncbi:MAG: AMP-binding protein [Gammaproteobacteria bacterium]|nr:AMP-binding protein [Gammaproteobacteria bacterium]